MTDQIAGLQGAIDTLDRIANFAEGVLAARDSLKSLASVEQAIADRQAALDKIDANRIKLEGTVTALHDELAALRSQAGSIINSAEVRAGEIAAQAQTEADLKVAAGKAAGEAIFAAATKNADEMLTSAREAAAQSAREADAALALKVEAEAKAAEAQRAFDELTAKVDAARKAAAAAFGL